MAALVWTSSDHLDKVVRAGKRLYLLGGNRDGRRAWQSSNGSTWSELGPLSGLDGGVNDVARVGGMFVAVGWTEDAGGNSVAAVWRSTDGVEWQQVGSPEGVEELWAVAGRDDTLFAYGRWPLLSLPLIVYSTDLGDTWRAAQTDLGVSDDFNVGLLSVAVDDRRFVIVGYHELDDYAPIVLTSRDGSDWSSITLPFPPGYGLKQVVALRGASFLALGSGGSAHVSDDGRSWSEAAPLYTNEEPPRPPEGGDEVVTFRQLAANRAGVVVTQAWGDGVRAWFAPLSMFD